MASHVRGQLQLLSRGLRGLNKLASGRGFHQTTRRYDQLRFDGKVAVVTGGGNGLGRQYALSFAARGAQVVVNDLGGGADGKGQSGNAADNVVKEITDKGGKAVANYDSVEDGEKIVETAMSNFGRVDILVNNAGILRDKTFARISDEDWDIVNRVHLRGSFKVSQAAWPHMKKQNYGRILMTTSSSGLYGNFGQANYAAAKSGLVGLSNTLAREGEKNNILCNAIGPIALSRMTEALMPPDFHEKLKPDFVEPLVVYLCHESCGENGGVFEAGGGWVGRTRWQQSEGKILRYEGQGFTAEDVRDNWNTICDFTDATYPTGNDRIFAAINELEEEPAASGPIPDGLNREFAMKNKFKDTAIDVSHDHISLYNLGIGVSTKDSDHLKFLYEGADGFAAIPSFAAIPAMRSMGPAIASGLPGLKLDFTKLLHGEQYVELFKKIPTSGKLINKCRVADVLDKGKGGVILLNVDTFDENNDKVAFNQFTIFIRGAGGFGGPKDSTEMIGTAEPPSREPDASLTDPTTIDQAALYRQSSGDWNPLHIDPDFAAMGGFKTPILHGMCTFGYATRHVLKQYAGNDTSKIKSIKARFAGPVLPGETIQTDMWKEGNRVFFRSTVKETGAACLTGGYIDLVEGGEGQQAASSADSAGSSPSDKIFGDLGNQVAGNADLVKSIKSVFAFQLSDGENVNNWTVDLKTGSGSVYKGEPKDKADCTVIISEELFPDLVSGKLNGQQAFMTGKLKLKGNMMLAQKLEKIFSSQPKPAEATTQESAPVDDGSPSSAIFADLGKQLEGNPDLVKKIKSVFNFQLTTDGESVEWTVDLKNGNGSVYKGGPKDKADCTVIIAENLFPDLISGKLNGQQAFMTGKLKLKGNMMLAQKLEQIFKK